MFSYMIWVLQNFKWACNFLIQFCLFGHRINADEHLVYVTPQRFEFSSRAEAVECAVCLSDIEEEEEEEEEITELRCHHLFHRVCLDAWIGDYNYATCPVCRYPIPPPAGLVTGLGEEVIVFKFSRYSSRNERDTWWLR